MHYISQLLSPPLDAFGNVPSNATLEITGGVTETVPATFNAVDAFSRVVFGSTGGFAFVNGGLKTVTEQDVPPMELSCVFRVYDEANTSAQTNFSISWSEA